MNKYSLTISIKYILISLTLFLTPLVSNASLIFINEIHYDNSGADKDEFVELAGTAGLNLFDWSLQFYNGSTGLIYKTVVIDDITLDDNNNGFGFLALKVSGIQNGAANSIGDGIAIVNSSNQVMQFLSYEGAFEANNGAALGMLSHNISMSQISAPKGKSLQLTTTGNTYDEFTWVIEDSTFGNKNVGQHFTKNKLSQGVPVSEPNLQIIFMLLTIKLFLSRKRVGILKIRNRLIL
jgi:hypothetical protein